MFSPIFAPFVGYESTENALNLGYRLCMNSLIR